MVVGGISAMIYVDTEFQLLNPHSAGVSVVTGGGGTGGGIVYVTNQYGAYQGEQAWLAAGVYDWTVPPDVTRAWQKLWAAGGGGAYFAGDDWKVGGDGG